jgi:hypothetical protein
MQSTYGECHTLTTSSAAEIFTIAEEHFAMFSTRKVRKPAGSGFHIHRPGRQSKPTMRRMRPSGLRTFK